MKEDESKQIENKNDDDIEIILRKKILDVEETSKIKGLVKEDEPKNKEKKNDNDIELISKKKVVDGRDSDIIREQLNAENCLEIKKAMLENLDLTSAENLNRIDPMTSPGTQRELNSIVINFIFSN